MNTRFTSLEICAGAGGQALGLAMAGFEHAALVEIDPQACQTLRLNRPSWQVIETDLLTFSGIPFRGIDLLSGGVPCPPFSVAGKQLGSNDERDLFPTALRLVEECSPRAVLLENVRGLLDPKFAEYRQAISKKLETLGYRPFWKLLYASNFGVPQLRPRTVLVALHPEDANFFSWPETDTYPRVTVSEALFEELSSRGWPGVRSWGKGAQAIGPTLVGGSKKHGGADLGPSRAKQAWQALGIDGKGIADEAPGEDFIGMPRLTIEMTQLIQGFPKEWQITGKKTSAYRQVGNAFPPPVARAVGEAIQRAFRHLHPPKQEFRLLSSAPSSQLIAV